MMRSTDARQLPALRVAGPLMIAAAVVLGLLLATGILMMEQTRQGAGRLPATASGARDTGVAAPAVPVALPAASPTAAATAVPTASVAAPTAAVPAPAVPSPAVPQPAAGTAPEVGSADAGRTVFAGLCTGCHPNGSAGFGPALKGLPAEVITRVAREGRGAMPAYGGNQLSDQQLRDIVAFLEAS